MIVVDASAVAEILVGSEVGARVATRVFAARKRHAPHLLDIEVASALRKLTLARRLTPARLATCIEDLRLFPMRRHAHAPLLPRVAELRHNLTAYDAVYLALAEALAIPLVTCDAAFADVAGAHTTVELVA